MNVPHRRERFNLLDEPWIQVRELGGTLSEVSLIDAFARGQELRGVDGELPTQAFAITRLLLAVLTRTVNPNGEMEAQDWEELWHEGLPVEGVREYLERYLNRFDLLDPSAPFFQVADLATHGGEVKDVTPLILDLPSNKRLFTNRAGASSTRLDYAEAARWLVNAQAFDPSGIKSGAVGDPRVKGGKGYPIGVAWSGLLGGILAEGTTLAQTLLLNLVEHAPSDRNRRDLAPWERAQDGPAQREHPIPTGPVDLMTWQSRRIRLVHDGTAVTGCVLANGDALTPQNGYRFGEQMTAWRYSEPQTKRAGTPTYMPRELDPSRALWRSVGGLLHVGAVDKRGLQSSFPPGIVDWLARLRTDERLADDQTIRLRGIGVQYGSNSSVVDEVFDDQVTFSSALLAAGYGEQLRQVVDDAVDTADRVVRALRHLAGNLAVAAGGDPNGPGDRAGELGYAGLDQPFRSWLATLSADSDARERRETWRRTAVAVMSRLGRELVSASGPAAWRGREVRRIGSTDPLLVTTARAESWFRQELHRLLPEDRESTGAHHEVHEEGSAG